MPKRVLCTFLLSLLCVSFTTGIPGLIPVAQTSGNSPITALMGSQFAWPGPSGTQIDTWDGSLTLSRTEAELPSRVPIMIAFSYHSSLSNVSSPYGYGWRFSHNIYYLDDENETTVVWGNGGSATFLKDKVNGGYINFPGITDVLAEYTPHKLVLTTKDDFNFYFDNANQRHVTRVEDRNGNMILLNYDRFGLLTNITDDRSSFSVGFYYDDNGMLKQVQLPHRVLTFAYDDQEDLTTIKTLDPVTYDTIYESSYSYDPSHLLTSISDPLNRTVSIEYSGSRVTRITSPLTDTRLSYDSAEKKTTIVERIDDVEQTTTLFFDDQGRCQRIQDTQGNNVIYEWDQNNIISITDQKGNSTRYTYDSNRNPLTITDASGNITQYTYRANSNDITTYTDARGDTWTNYYDDAGKLTQKTDPLGNNVTYWYNAQGDQTEIDYPNGTSITFDYNDFGRVTRKAYSTGYYLNYSYDNSGNLIKVTDPLGNSVEYAYDPMNRIVSQKDRQGRTASFTYDAYSNLIRRVDPGDRVTLFEYDALDRLTRVVDPLNHETRFNYSSSGQTKTVSDAMGHATTFTYDVFNRLIKVTDALGNNATFTYDAVDNMLSATDQNGNTTYFSYDALNRLTTIDYPGSDDVHYSYDQMGNVVRLANSYATMNYTYDALGRLVEVKDITHDETVRYSYDAMGNLLQLFDPFGKATNYTYDEQNRITSITDPSGQTTNFDYTLLGWLNEKHYPNGITAFYGYNDAGDLTYLMYQNSTGQTLRSYTCEYDEIGNMVRVIEGDGNTTLYGYDLLNQLVNITYPDGTTSRFTYDAVGNRLSMTSTTGTTNYVYDACNRLLQAGTTTYEWDNNGNLKAKNAQGGRTTYEYDPANRLTSIGYADGTATNYEYYPDGRLLSKATDGSKNYYIYNGPNVLYETDGLWNPIAEYSSIGIDNGISVKQSGNYYYYLYDYVGSVIGIADSNGKLVSTCSYDAFGAPLKLNGGVSDARLFIGREFDAKSQLYNLRARFYDPSTGRFISRDPLSNYFAPYVYASNNPVTWADPSGLTEERALEPQSDYSPCLYSPTSMEQKKEVWEDVAQSGVEDSNALVGGWKYTVGKWESGILSELDWLKNNWKNILYGILGVSGTGTGATGVGLWTGTLGSHGCGPEPFYLAWESTFRHTFDMPQTFFPENVITVKPGSGGLHLGINKTYWKSDWIFHVGVPEHVAETPFGQGWTKIFGPGKPIQGTAHYFPLKAGAQALIILGFLAAPIIGLKGCDKQKEEPIPPDPNAHVDVNDVWTYSMHLRTNPDSDGYAQDTVWDGNLWLYESDGNVTGHYSYTRLTIDYSFGVPVGSFGPFFVAADIDSGTLQGNKLTLVFYYLDIWNNIGLTAYLNRIGTCGNGAVNIGGGWPTGFAKNESAIRVDASMSFTATPDVVEPRYGPHSDVTVELYDLSAEGYDLTTAGLSSFGGPITFENLNPETATLSNYVDLGPKAKVRINALVPEGEVRIRVRTPHVLQQDFTVEIHPTSTWYVNDIGSGDFSSIQDAINAASPHDTVQVWPGTYRENVIIDKPLSLVGDYYKGSIIDGGGLGNALTVQADNVTIEGFTMTNSSGHYPDSGLFLDNVNNTLVESNIMQKNSGYGVFISGGNNNTMTQNEMCNNTKAGLRIDRTNSTSTIIYNSIHDNTEDGIFTYEAQDLWIDGNDFYLNGGCGASIQGNSRNITLSNNRFMVNSLSGLSIFVSTNITASANDFISNQEYGIYLFESNNNTIQNNIFATKGYEIGGNIRLGDGIYVWNSSNNRVYQNVIKEGRTNDAISKPLVYLENESNKSITNAGQVILVNCTDITVEGLNATHVDVGLELWLTNNTIVTESTFMGNLYGIMMYDSAGNSFYHNNFINNTQSQVYFLPDSAVLPNAWDNDHLSGGNYWSNYADTDTFSGPGQNVSGSDGIWDHAYVIDANNTDHYPLVSPWVQKAGLVVRGMDNRIYYRVWNGASWEGWNVLPGSTMDSPAAALLGNQLHIVVRGSDGNSLWYGYLANITDPSSFSGWTLLSGATSSAPTLASNGTALCLVVRGEDNRIYYRVYNDSSWGDWAALQSGATLDSPAAVMLGDELHIVVRGMDGYSLWHCYVNLTDNSFSGWTLLSGATQTRPVLAADQTDNKLCLAVTGLDGRIYWRTYDVTGQSWADWSVIPSGATPEGPTVTIFSGTLQIAVQGMDGSSMWQGAIDLSTTNFSGWTLLSGATTSAPTLTS